VLWERSVRNESQHKRQMASTIRKTYSLRGHQVYGYSGSLLVGKGDMMSSEKKRIRQRAFSARFAIESFCLRSIGIPCSSSEVEVLKYQFIPSQPLFELLPHRYRCAQVVLLNALLLNVLLL